MLLVVLKLGETLARALFLFICIYSLEKEQSGQFGIIITLTGLFAFAFGYERHIDIQRKYADSPNALFDSIVASSFKIYALNYLLMIPLYVVCVVHLGQLSIDIAIVCVVIVVSEHISNKTYNLSLVNSRYRTFLVLTVTKYLFNLVTLAYWVFWGEETLNVHNVLTLWASTSIVCSVMILVIWWRINLAETREIGVWEEIKSQYKHSFSHFMIGLLAILSLQLDRIIASSMLPLEDVGLYFRHVTLIAYIYQFYSIASFNRILPVVYGNAQRETAKVLKSRVRREYIKVVAMALSMLACLFVVYYSPLQFLYDKFELQIELLCILLTTFVIRAAADFNGLIYNAKRREKSVLLFQFLALMGGVVAFIVLTSRYGMLGTVISSLISACIYLSLTEFKYKTLDEQRA